MSLISEVLVLFLLILAGWGARRARILNEASVKGINGLVLYVALPALNLSSMQRPYDSVLLASLGQTLAISLGIHLASLALGWMLTRKLDRRQRSALMGCIILSNVGFMGYPMTTAALGEQALLYAVLYNVGFNLFVWTLGVTVFTGKMDPRGLLNPGLLAAIAGLLLFLARVTLPPVLARALELLAGLTTPLSMVLVGATLEGVSPKQVFSPLVGVAALLRLVLMPALAFGALKLMGVSGLTLSVPVLLTAMPAATMLTMLTEEHGGDTALAGQMIVGTTALSLITVPLMVHLLGIG